MARGIGRKVNTGPTGISRTVFMALVRPGQAATLREHMAPHAWKAVVSPVVANASRALNVTNGILTVAVKSAAWANELGMQKTELLQKINHYINGTSRRSVTDIRFVNQPWADAPPQAEYNLPWRAEDAYASNTKELSVVERIAILADIASERDKARIRSGWIYCRTCGDLIAPNGPDDPSRCARCRNDF